MDEGVPEGVRDGVKEGVEDGVSLGVREGLPLGTSKAKQRKNLGHKNVASQHIICPILAAAVGHFFFKRKT